ncbi:MAG: nucleotidyl transferase AbiEii/AbiGii toxin family protein [Burkholderiaceae bacterium]|nr:nucleotidyl transferase AbiEii/AbiGii toxin family protein [Burkholderiaceae bacterium]
MPDRPRNIGASVRQRLLNLAHARRQPMELLLTRYALERLLHRLSLSPHRERFVLKGAMLLATWFDEPHRATRDVDLLGFGDAADDALLRTFREIMALEVDDGVSFDLKGLRIEAIREEVEYGGSRLRTTAALAGARIPITVDIGFGDAVEPGVEDIDLPVLLDMPSPHLRAYPVETVIAEKFHAMVVLGRANSRMKDYYDVWMLTNTFEIKPERLQRAVVATFARRKTEIPASVPDGLSDDFYADAGKQRQWDAFARTLSGQVPELGRVVVALREKLIVTSAQNRL